MARKKPKKFTVCDGDLVLELQPAGDGWYCVTSPMDPGVTTQAKSIEEAFDMARDAMKCLKDARRIVTKRRQQAAKSAA